MLNSEWGTLQWSCSFADSGSCKQFLTSFEMWHVSTLSYIWFKTTQNYHDTYFRWSVAAGSIFMSVSSHWGCLQSSSLFLCFSRCVCVCVCVSTKTSTTTKTPQPWQFHSHSFTFLTPWCKVANSREQLYFILHILVRCCSFCYLFQSRAKIHKHVELAFSHCKDY